MNASDGECREWAELGMEVAAQQQDGGAGCRCATCLLFVSLSDIVKARTKETDTKGAAR